MRLAANRPGLGTARMLVDMVAGSLEQVHSANKELMPKQTVHTRCSTECQVHLDNSWRGQSLQIRVSLVAGDGGKISLAKTES